MVEEGEQNNSELVGVMAALTAAQAAQGFMEKNGPLIEGVAGIYKNIVWGEKVTVRTVDPKKIDKAFNDSKVFVAEIKAKFPNSHNRIVRIRNDLK